TQGVVRNLEDVALAPGDTAEDRRAPRQLGHLAGELPGPEGRDDRRFIARVVEDLDRAGVDDVDVTVALPGFEELLPLHHYWGSRFRQRRSPKGFAAASFSSTPTRTSKKRSRP